MSRSAIPPWPTAFSTGWCTTLTASRCAASRCGRNAAARNEPRRYAPNTPSGAVEMPPRGKRGSRQVGTHPSHRAWKSGQGQPDSHISTAPAASLFRRKEKRNDEKNRYQLTDSGHFKHDKNASVASLRKRPASPRNQRPDSNRNHCPPSGEYPDLQVAERLLDAVILSLDSLAATPSRGPG